MKSQSDFKQYDIIKSIIIFCLDLLTNFKYPPHFEFFFYEHQFVYFIVTNINRFIGSEHLTTVCRMD